MKKVLITSFIFLFGLCFSFLTGQETQQASLGVHGQVSASVSVSATSMDFGELSSQSSAEAEAVISVTAMTGTIYNIALDAGQNYDGNFRRMTNQGGEGGATPGTIFVNYRVWGEAGNPEIPWGDSDFANTYPEGPSKGPFTGDGTTQTYPVFGLADPVTGVILDYFSDVITVTVHY
jgi:spore coat protein U-like protein